MRAPSMILSAVCAVFYPLLARRAKAHGKGASCSVMLPMMRLARGGMSRFESGSPARAVSAADVRSVRINREAISAMSVHN
jgi:hypothetical protein